jgi:hypothetical protein
MNKILILSLLSIFYSSLYASTSTDIPGEVVYTQKDGFIWDFAVRGQERLLIADDANLFYIRDGQKSELPLGETFAQCNFEAAGNQLLIIKTSVNSAQDAATSSYLWTVETKSGAIKKLSSLRLLKPIQLAGGHGKIASWKGKVVISASEGFGVIDPVNKIMQTLKPPRGYFYSGMSLEQDTAYLLSSGGRATPAKVKVAVISLEPFAMVREMALKNDLRNNHFFDLLRQGPWMLVSHYQGVDLYKNELWIKRLPWQVVWKMKLSADRQTLYFAQRSPDAKGGYQGDGRIFALPAQDLFR